MLKRLLIGILLLSPAVAMADPISAIAALAPVIGGTAAAFVVTVGTFLVSNWAIVTLVAGTIYGRRKARKAAAAARAAYNASLQDRAVSALQTTPAWRIPYGEYVGGGDVVDILTSDKTTKKEWGSIVGTQTTTKPDAYKHVVYHVATCSMTAVSEVYIDGVPVGALDVDGWATAGDFASTRAAGRAKVFTTTVTLDEPVVEVISCYETDPTSDWLHTDVTPTLSGGNLIVTVPAGKTVTFNYKVNETTSSVRVRKFLDAEESKAAYLTSIAPTEDTTDSHLYGMSVVVVTLDLTEPRFQDGSIIQRVTFAKKGKALYDPRTGLTGYSNNNALCIRDYLCGEYGYECTDADIDDDILEAAANACDPSINLTVGGTTTPGATYVCNGEVTTDASQEAVLEDMAESMAGFTAYGAKWQVHAGAWTPPVMDLTDDDLDGQISIIQAGAGMDELFNGARGTYVPAGKAQPTDCEPYQNTVFAADDGRDLWTDFTLPFTDNKARAKNLFRIFVERNRSSQVIQYPAKFRAFPLQIGDRVRVTSEEYGFDQKLYRVTDWQFGLTSPVLLTLQEDAAEIYDLADATSADPTPNTNLPDPWVVSALTGVSATSSPDTMSRSGVGGSISPRVVMAWDAVTDAYVTDGGKIEIQWRRPGKDFQRSTWPGDSEEAEIIGVNDAEPLVIRIRAVNSMGAVGPWTYLAHTVDGPTSVRTDDALANAWTDVVNGSSSSGASLPGGGGTVAQARASITYTNQQNYTMPVDVDVALQECGFAWNTSTPSVGRLSYRYSSTSLGTVRKTLFNASLNLSAGGNFGPIAAIDRVNLPAGETLTLELLWELTHTDSCSLTVTNSTTRITAIKK